jgi:hypothetical protein
VIATQSTLSNAIALIPTITVGVAIDLIAVRPVALTIALLLVIGAIAGRRIGAERRATATRPTLDVAPTGTAMSNVKGRKQ